MEYSLTAESSTHLSALDLVKTAHLAIGICSEMAVWNMVDWKEQERNCER